MFETDVDFTHDEKQFIRGVDLQGLIEEADFVSTAFLFLRGRAPEKSEKKMFGAVLVSLSGGVGIRPPTVLIPRIVASTKATVPQCLAAGMAAAGESHASAIQKTMETYKEILDKGVEPSEFVKQSLEKGRRIPGFGHPLYKRDPRPITLVRLAKKNGKLGKYTKLMLEIEKEMEARKGIYANIDGVASAILLDLGFENPLYGPSIFLFSRTLSMIAHVIEENERKPWQAWKDLLDHEAVRESDLDFMKKVSSPKR
jgi:citrate synthase